MTKGGRAGLIRIRRALWGRRQYLLYILDFSILCVVWRSFEYWRFAALRLLDFSTGLPFPHWEWWRRAYLYVPLFGAVAINVLWVKKRAAAQAIYLLLLMQLVNLTVWICWPLWCMSKVAVLADVFAATLVVVSGLRRRILSVRSWCYYAAAVFGFAAAVVLFVNDVMPRGAPGRECEAVRRNPELEMLVDQPMPGRPRSRFLLYRAKRKDLLIVYRNPEPQQPKVEQFDLTNKTFRPLPLPTGSECIGAYYDEGRDLVLLVVETAPGAIFAERNIENKYGKKLFVFDGDFAIVKRIDFPEVPYDDYNAYMFGFGNGVVIQGESTFFFDLDTFKLERRDLRRRGERTCAIVGEGGFTRVAGDRVVVSGGGDPLPEGFD